MKELREQKNVIALQAYWKSDSFLAAMQVGGPLLEFFGRCVYGGRAFCKIWNLFFANVWLSTYYAHSLALLIIIGRNHHLYCGGELIQRRSTVYVFEEAILFMAPLFGSSLKSFILLSGF